MANLPRRAFLKISLGSLVSLGVEETHALPTVRTYQAGEKTVVRGATLRLRDRFGRVGNIEKLFPPIYLTTGENLQIQSTWELDLDSLNLRDVVESSVTLLGDNVEQVEMRYVITGAP